MPEPHSSTIGIAVGAGIGLTGTVLGAQVDALIIGLVAAILISIQLPTIDDRKKAAASVALSSMFAGYGSPVASAWMSSQHAGVDDAAPLRWLLALVIGASAPTLVPVILAKWKRKAEAQ